VSPERTALVRRVAGRVPEVAVGWVRVAIDGVDAAGKTTFADELAAALVAQGRVVVRASVDGFHHTRRRRHHRGRGSWEGFWLDAFDYQQLQDPLQPGGSGRYRSAVHDLATDQRLDLPYEQASPGAILLLDGVFLHRDELVDSWDLSIFLEVPFGISVARMAARDGTYSSPDAASVQRYVQAQRHYLTTSSPHTCASLVIDNSDLERPVLLV